MSSLGDYSSKSSFGEAFKAAHARAGPGHTFSYNGNLFTTNCADKGDYCQKPDNRSILTHVIHQKGHEVNAMLKRNDLGSLDWMPVFGTDFGQNSKKEPWPAGKDDERALFHKFEGVKSVERTYGEAAKRHGYSNVGDYLFDHHISNSNNYH